MIRLKSCKTFSFKQVQPKANINDRTHFHNCARNLDSPLGLSRIEPIRGTSASKRKQSGRERSSVSSVSFYSQTKQIVRLIKLKGNQVQRSQQVKKAVMMTGLDFNSPKPRRFSLVSRRKVELPRPETEAQATKLVAKLEGNRQILGQTRQLVALHQRRIKAKNALDAPKEQPIYQLVQSSLIPDVGKLKEQQASLKLDLKLKKKRRPQSKLVDRSVFFNGSLSTVGLSKLEVEFKQQPKQRDYELIEYICGGLLFFRTFPKQFFRKLLRSFELVKLQRHRVLVSWGDPVRHIFVIVKGMISKFVALSQDYEQQVSVVESFTDGAVLGDIISRGEQDYDLNDLFTEEPEKVADFKLVIEQPTVLLRICKRKYALIVNQCLHKSLREQINCLKELTVFRPFQRQTLIPLAASSTRIKCHRNELIVKQGESSYWFYVIVSGKVRIIRFASYQRETGSDSLAQPYQLQLDRHALIKQGLALEGIAELKQSIYTVTREKGESQRISFEVLLDRRKAGDSFCYRPFLQAISLTYPEIAQLSAAEGDPRLKASVFCDSQDCVLIRVDPSAIMNFDRGKLYKFVEEVKKIEEFDDISTPKDISTFMEWETLKSRVLKHVTRNKYREYPLPD